MAFILSLMAPILCLLYASNALVLSGFPVHLSTAEVVDHTRLDPFAPTPMPRSLMMSIFKPVRTCHKKIMSPYMPPATAVYEDAAAGRYAIPNGTFQNTTLATCEAELDQEVEQPPLVLLSGALATSRFFYNALAASIASDGYVVVTVDHPYDTDIVEFPSGRTIHGLNLTEAQIPLAVQTRALDLTFLSRILRRGAFSGCQGATGLVGHSLGGAGVIAALREDQSFAGGINLDGSVFGPSVERGTSRPVLLFGHEGKNRDTDPTWQALWPNLRSWKKIVNLAGSAHYTFSDLPLLAEALVVAGELPRVPTQLVGSRPGSEAFRTISSYVVGFLDQFAKGDHTSSLNNEADH